MSAERVLGRLAIGLALLAPVAAGLFKVWVHHDSVQVGYQLSEREEQRKRLRNETQQLEVELAAERTPAHLMQLARELGMTPASPEQVPGEQSNAKAARAVASPKASAAKPTAKPATKPVPAAAAKNEQGGASGRP